MCRCRSSGPGRWDENVHYCPVTLAQMKRTLFFVGVYLFFVLFFANGKSLDINAQATNVC